MRLPFGIYLLAVVGIFGLAFQFPARAQHHDHATKPIDDAAATAFVQDVRDAMVAFRDRDRAIAAGYRQVGPDFPGMGEHWVHPRKMFARDVDPASPPVLSYVEIDGRAVLTGAAFAMPIGDGQDPPDLPFGDVWHVHEGTVDEETLVLNPGVKIRGTESATRLAMFHVWTDLENPGGVFAQDNWRLPFVRLGLSAPNDITSDAGKAVFLLNGGHEYYRELLRLAGRPSVEEMARFDDVLESAADRVRVLIDSTSGDPGIERLGAEWTRMWDEIERVASDGTWKALHPLSR